MAQAPEVEVVTTPNVQAGGGDGGALGLVLVGLGSYLLVREASAGGLLGSLGIHLPEGGIAGVTYAGTAPTPGAQVAARVQVHNPTLLSKTYTVYGYIVPVAQATPAAAVGHFWPDYAAGVTPNTAYRGGTLTVGPLGTAMIDLYSAPWGVTGQYSVIWQLWLPGGTAPVATRTDAGVITSAATSPGPAAPAAAPAAGRPS